MPKSTTTNDIEDDYDILGDADLQDFSKANRDEMEDDFVLVPTEKKFKKPEDIPIDAGNDSDVSIDGDIPAMEDDASDENDDDLVWNLRDTTRHLSTERSSGVESGAEGHSDDEAYEAENDSEQEGGKEGGGKENNVDIARGLQGAASGCAC